MTSQIQIVKRKKILVEKIGIERERIATIGAATRTEMIVVVIVREMTVAEVREIETETVGETRIATETEIEMENDPLREKKRDLFQR